MNAGEFRKQLQGYGLTTANILYRMPDHPAVLQTYVWQAYDLAPLFPGAAASSSSSGGASWRARCIRCRSRIGG